ncbi:MAG: hypothetical protein NZX77_22990, partial [Polyangiaceae bacterium]|nr:hypothetical protein [Polyangiaceae bacterium]
FEPIPQLRAYEPQVPEFVEQVVMKSLDRDPARRFTSCAEFADALERACQQVGFHIATVRETAACVQQIIGHEIQQQRAAVRAWLAEPSQQGAPDMASLAALRTSKPPTQHRNTPLPSPKLPPAHSPPSSDQLAALPALDSGDVVAALNEASSSGNRPPSTTGGAMALPQVPASTSIPVPPASSRHRVVIPVALVTLLALAFLGWNLRSTPSASTSVAVAPSSSLPAGVLVVVSAPASSPAPASAEPSAPTTTIISVDALPSERIVQQSSRRPNTSSKKGEAKDDKKDTTSAPPPPPTLTPTSSPPP